MAVLNFDWDDVSFDNLVVQQAFSHLATRYPDQIWWRVSSSGTGLHVMVAELSPELTLIPRQFPEAEVIAIRSQFHGAPYHLECGGRLRADGERRAHGFSIGRLFAHKNGATAGEWRPW